MKKTKNLLVEGNFLQMRKVGKRYEKGKYDRRWENTRKLRKERKEK